MKKDTFMKEKPVFPLIISMALPMIISMCVNSLYNIVDSYFVAKISEDAMTSLSLVFPVQNFINAVAIGFGVGINAVIAFYLGAGDKNKADSAATARFSSFDYSRCCINCHLHFCYETFSFSIYKRRKCYFPWCSVL